MVDSTIPIENDSFLLYYTALLQLVLCVYIFSPKLEWVILLCVFFVLIIHGYGLLVHLKTGNEFVAKFKELSVISTITPYLEKINVPPEYLLVLPLLANLISVKLISDYDGNKRLSSNKQFVNRMYVTKGLLCVNILLFAIVCVFGFPIPLIKEWANRPVIALIGISISSVLSLFQLVISSFIYSSYWQNSINH